MDDFYDDKDATSLGDKLGINPDELRELSQEDLINLIVDLDRRVPKVTEQLAPEDAPTMMNKPSVHDVRDFIKIPDRDPASDEEMRSMWQVIFYSLNPEIRPLGVEMFKEITVGRSAPGSPVDLDFSAFGAARLGVSRKHAMFRPTYDSLLIIDLGSTNGTSVNEEILTPGEARQLHENDTIALARMLFTLKFADSPLNR